MLNWRRPCRYANIDPDVSLEAMRTGADVIVQAGLAEGRRRGLADLLLRVERPSSLGAWSYEVADTKLAQPWPCIGAAEAAR